MERISTVSALFMVIRDNNYNDFFEKVEVITVLKCYAIDFRKIIKWIIEIKSFESNL